MKRISNVFWKVVDMDTLRKAAKACCAHRKDKREVAEFKKDAEAKLQALRQSVLDGTFVSSEYIFRHKQERGKTRLIADIALYPDRILHTAVCIAAEDELNRKLISQTYSGRRGMGQHLAVSKMAGYLREDPKIKYALLVDVHQFYASIDKDILKEKLRRSFKDERFLQLIFQLIDDYPRGGIPLGSRFSTMLANLYLSEMDHVLSEEYHVHYKARFADDYAILGYSKPWLRRILGVIQEELAKVKLELNSNWQIFPVDARGLRFLGYVIYSDHVLLKKETKKRMQRAAGHISERLENNDYIMDRHDLGTIHSYEGCLKWCDAKHLQHLTFDEIYEKNRMNLERKKVIES